MLKIKLKLNNKTIEVDQYSTLINLITDKDVIAAKTNNKIISLQSYIKCDSIIEPIKIDTTTGARTYRQTLCFILSMAAKEVLPDKKLIIGHSLGHTFYYYFKDYSVTPRELEMVKKRMKEIVQKDYPIKENYLSWSAAQKLSTAIVLKSFSICH
ncbi:MAG: hypothetical protein B6229_03520 [Spirochaetaceae bacterium 4572_7]|nr:MAG: hypothetical protein B6229_03520 [Spirochaetaceae bacterium 4572_7]